MDVAKRIIDYLKEQKQNETNPLRIKQLQVAIRLMSTGYRIENLNKQGK